MCRRIIVQLFTKIFGQRLYAKVKYLLIDKAFINNKYLKVLTVFSSILTVLGCLNSVVNYFFFTEVFCDLVSSVNYDVVKDGKLI